VLALNREAQDFNAFPVVDGRGVLQGIVTKLDLLRMFRPTRYRWLPELRPLAGERVADIMTREIVGVGPGDPVAVAVDLMIAYQLRSLPVLERREGRPALVGIVSRTDVLRCLMDVSTDGVGRARLGLGRDGPRAGRSGRPNPPIRLAHPVASPLHLEASGLLRPARAGRRAMFANREAAGRALAERLAPLVGAPCVVAGIPRGGVAVALPVAERLGAPLAAVFAHKLSAPFAPELAFGAIDEDGEAILDAATVAVLGLAPEDVEMAKAGERRAIERRIARYGAPALAPLLPGRAAVLVDDGLATGLTMRAALAYVRRHGAREVTVATPVASGEAAARFAREADRFVSLVVDDAFRAVGEYYADFAPVPDQAVVAMLARAREAVQ